MQNNKSHVLIVEDDPDTAAVLAIALRLEGHHAATALTIAQAYEHLGNEPVDLLLLDWRLPDGTAEQFALAARALKPALPIIVMTGWLDEKEKAIEGCHPVLFLEKPIEMEALHRSVESLLAKTRD